MSIVFGVFAADGEPMHPEELAAMAEVVAYPDHEPVSIWQDKGIALAAVRLSTTPESCGEVLPLRHDPTGVVVTAHVRLDNREELLHALGIQDADVPDGRILLHAYLEWGEAFAEHLLGDFGIAVWDPRERKLLVVRDHHGTSPMFYHAAGSLCVFSNSTSALLAHPKLPKTPDLLRLGQLLASWPSDGIRTAYADISRLPSGHLLVAAAHGMRVRPYWALDPSRKLAFRSDEECLEVFSAVYAEAVACRLRSRRPIGVSLSGGLDSGSVCALAARELGARNLPLHAFTSVPQRPADLFGPNRFGDESSVVETYRDTAPNLQVCYCRAEDTSPLAGVDRALAAMNEPVHGASNLFWMASLSAAAHAHGVGVLLTGQMGNGTVSLQLHGRMSPAQLAREYLLASWARPLRNLARRAASGGAELWLAFSPLSREFARKMRLRELRRGAGLDPEFRGPTNPEKVRLELTRLCLQTTGASWVEMGAAFGIEVLDPTADKRVIEFCLAAPIEQFWAEGLDRSLLRRSMKGLMPDSVRLGRRRGRQAADLGYRILATDGEFQQALQEMERHPLACEVLDLPKMRRVLADLRKQVNGPNTNMAGAVLMRGLMVGRFLQRF